MGQGRGILETQGVSGEGGAITGAAAADSGSWSMAEVPTDLVTTAAPPTLASLVGVLSSAWVMVSLLRRSTFWVWVVLVLEDFLLALGELTDSRRDTLGDIDLRRHGEVRLESRCLRSCGTSAGGSRLRSATRGD